MGPRPSDPCHGAGMYVPVFALIHAQHGLVTSRQLAEAGLPAPDVRRLVQHGRLVPVRRGVYADADTWHAADPFVGQPLLRVRAARHTLGARTYVFSHDSAAIPLGMGAPSSPTALVHVTRHKTHGDAVRAGVKHHLAPYLPSDVVQVDGLPLLGLPRTAIDMVREHGRAAGLAACDAAMRLGTSRGELADTFSRMRCWPHSRTVRWCIEMADDGAESYLESTARDLVLELGIGRPHTQLGLTDGVRLVWCDIHVGRHVFEVDGLLKYDATEGADPRVVLREEKRRQDFIGGFKLGVSRITAQDCATGRPAALARLHREYADTCRRFGTSVDDLAPYVVPRSRRRRAV